VPRQGQDAGQQQQQQQQQQHQNQHQHQHQHQQWWDVTHGHDDESSRHGYAYPHVPDALVDTTTTDPTAGPSSSSSFTSTSNVQQQQLSQLAPLPTAVPLRRFCIPCGLRHRLHNPGDMLHRKGGSGSGSGSGGGGISWVCGCREARDRAESVPACPVCGSK
jgi:hypothetical protein